MNTKSRPDPIGPSRVRSRRLLGRLGATVAAASFIVLSSLWPTFAQQIPLPAAAPKKAKDLLTAQPFDRLKLIDDTEWEIEPIAPRPFVLFDPKKSRKRKTKSVEEIRAEGGNVAIVGKDQAKIEPLEYQEEPPILIHMIEGEVRDYNVKHEHIKALQHFEDMLLAEADKLIAQHDFTKAFEYILYVQSRDPNWKGLKERVDKLLFEEGSTALLDGEGERGLRLLSDLHSRRPDYPGLVEKLVGSYASRVTKAYNIGMYAKGRQILRELNALAPDAFQTREVRDKFIAGATDLVKKSDAAKNSGQKLDLLTDAIRIWPDTEGLDAKYDAAFKSDPTLDVAVSDLPRPIAPWRRSAASDRVTRLLYRPILASTDDAAVKGNAPGQLAAEIESFDLARGLRIRLKPGFAWSDKSRPVSSLDVARALADRAVASAPGFSARWGDLLQKVEVIDDRTVELRLSRACLKPEAWLLEPVGPAHAGWDGWVALVGQGKRPIGDGPFVWESSGKDVDLYRSADPAAKIKRLREIRYTSPSAAVAAFLRGETTLIEHLPSDRVKEIAAQPEILVGKYETPSIHRIAIDGRNPALKLRSLRRALSLAIDRTTLMTETLLRRPPDATNLPADGPFPKGSFADAPDVPPLTYDPLLAKMLVTAAKAELGGAGIIRLTLEYPPSSEARSICPRLADAWKAAGLDIILREVPEAELQAKVRSGERFDLAYLAGRPEPTAINICTLICPAYDSSPTNDPLASVASPRILQLLIDLDRAPEATSARELAIQIDRECRDELPMIPLWQLDDHYAWRSRLKGIKPGAGHLYDNLETWEIEPWFAKDTQ